MEGTKNLRELIDLTMTCVEIGVESLKDGKVGFEDLSQLMKLVPVVVPAFSDLDQLPKELADLQPEELQELVAHVMAKLAVEDAKARLIVEKSLKTAGAVFELVVAIAKPAA